ncbi:hypothetical protein [Enterobacter hormaechei]
MQNKKTIHVAVVDSCEFTMIGLQSLGKREPVKNTTLFSMDLPISKNLL